MAARYFRFAIFSVLSHLPCHTFLERHSYKIHPNLPLPIAYYWRSLDITDDVTAGITTERNFDHHSHVYPAIPPRASFRNMCSCLFSLSTSKNTLARSSHYWQLRNSYFLSFDSTTCQLAGTYCATCPCESLPREPCLVRSCQAMAVAKVSLLF